jgi:hypothetical protein
MYTATAAATAHRLLASQINRFPAMSRDLTTTAIIALTVGGSSLLAELVVSAALAMVLAPFSSSFLHSIPIAVAAAATPTRAAASGIFFLTPSP